VNPLRLATLLAFTVALPACSGGGNDKASQARDYAKQACAVIRTAEASAGPAQFIKAWLDVMEPAVDQATPLASSADVRDSKWSRLRLALVDTRQAITDMRALIDEVVNGTEYVGQGAKASDALDAQVPTGERIFAKVTAECELANAQ
jgi:hypothetical protein